MPLFWKDGYDGELRVSGAQAEVGMGGKGDVVVRVGWVERSATRHQIFRAGRTCRVRLPLPPYYLAGISPVIAFTYSGSSHSAPPCKV